MDIQDIATQIFIDNHTGALNPDLAVALIEQFGGEDKLMQEYVNALPHAINTNEVKTLTDNKELTNIYNEYKDSIIALGWRAAAELGFKYPINLYGSLSGLERLSESEIVEGMHNNESCLYGNVTAEIVRFAADYLCKSWSKFNKDKDDFGEALFCHYHL